MYIIMQRLAFGYPSKLKRFTVLTEIISGNYLSISQSLILTLYYIEDLNLEVTTPCVDAKAVNFLYIYKKKSYLLTTPISDPLLLLSVNYNFNYNVN